MMEYFEKYANEIAVILLICGSAAIVLIVCVCWMCRCRRMRSASNQPPILPTVSINDEPSCTNDAFYCVDHNDTSARKIEERWRARQYALQHNSPRADLSLRKIDPDIGKALAVEQLMRDTLMFDTLPRPTTGKVEIIAAKRDYL